MSESKSSPRRVSAAFKQRRALELRKGHLSYAAIAASPMDPRNGDMRPLYADKSGAKKAVEAALIELRADGEDDALDVRTLELARLDEMSARIYMQAVGGDPNAVDLVLKIMARRTKYQGLDYVDGLDERISAATDAEAARTQQAFETALRDFGLTDDEVEGVFGVVATLLRASTDKAASAGPEASPDGPGS